MGDVYPARFIHRPIILQINGEEIGCFGKNLAIVLIMSPPVVLIAFGLKDDLSQTVKNFDNGIGVIQNIFYKPSVVEAVSVGGDGFGHFEIVNSPGLVLEAGQGKGGVGSGIDHFYRADRTGKQAGSSASHK